MKEQSYYVSGMHCASCEVLIEKKLLEVDNIHSVDASVGNGLVRIEYEGGRPDPSYFNKIFKNDGYRFSLEEIIKESGEKFNPWIAVLVALIVVLAFILFSGRLTSLVNISSSSSLPTFVLLGVVAGFSSCAALVGGVVLSMSKQWAELYKREDGLFSKMTPHILFNLGRIFSYGFFGAALGALGGALKLSITFYIAVGVIVSILMLFLGMQMLGLKFLARYQIRAPKSFLRFVANEKNFKAKTAPLMLGALTFFLPCGFTLTVQSLALLSGNAILGSLMLFLFALGTTPSLILIGVASTSLLSKTHLSDYFLKVAGVLLVFFALFNLNNQLNAMGKYSFSDLFRNIGASIQIQNNNSNINSKNTENNGSIPLPPIENGRQIVRMKVTPYGYSPNFIYIRSGIPVLWEVEDAGISGCTNAIIARDIFDGSFDLKIGGKATKEFIIQKEGIYKFSCWMGMVQGAFRVVNDEKDVSVSKNDGVARASLVSKTGGCCCGNKYSK